MDPDEIFVPEARPFMAKVVDALREAMDGGLEPRTAADALLTAGGMLLLSAVPRKEAVHDLAEMVGRLADKSDETDETIILAKRGLL